MTSDTSQPSNHPAVEDPSGERCLRYLLGELDPTEAVAFEQELSRSADLSDQLLQQADLLCHLSQSIHDQGSQPALLAHRQTHVKTLVLIAALAACLAFVLGHFQTYHYNRNIAKADRGESASNESEDLDSLKSAGQSEASLIAQAWAASQTELSVMEDEFAIHQLDYESVNHTEEWVGDDSAFSWMVHAMSVDSDSPKEVVTSDG